MKKLICPTDSCIAVFCILSFLLSIQTYAQENPIYKLSEKQTNSVAHKASMSSSRTSSINYPNTLLFGLPTSIYVKNNTLLKVHGSGAPKVLKLKDVNSFNFLSVENKLFHKVKMITINISSPGDLSRVFYADKIRGFKDLKYIYIKSDFQITEGQVRAFIQNADPTIAIFYKIANPA